MLLEEINKLLNRSYYEKKPIYLEELNEYIISQLKQIEIDGTKIKETKINVLLALYQLGYEQKFTNEFNKLHICICQLANCCCSINKYDIEGNKLNCDYCILINKIMKENFEINEKDWINSLHPIDCMYGDKCFYYKQGNCRYNHS